ncbi:MAG: hypothetical protein GY944_01835 [bacterium]|nr:hypothetical protein [bacterium]
MGGDVGNGRLVRLVASVALAAGMSIGCASARIHNFDHDKPIDVVPGFLGGVSYWQNDQALSSFGLAGELEQYPDAKKHITHSRLLFWPAMVTALGSGVFLGLSEDEKNGNAMRDLGISLGLATGTFGMLVFSDRETRKAVEAYNARVRNRPREAEPEPEPQQPEPQQEKEEDPPLIVKKHKRLRWMPLLGASKHGGAVGALILF